MTGPLFLGLDLSTQQLKGVVLTQDLGLVTEQHVHFDTDLAKYGTKGGARAGEGGTVTVPTIMWVEALDLLLDKLVRSGTDLSLVAGVSGGAQQQGSVYWARGVGETLSSLNPDLSLHCQLGDVFSVSQSPIWLDSSTSTQVSQLMTEVPTFRSLTGHSPAEGMTVTQVMKVYQTTPDLYLATSRIGLVSSLLTSLLTGLVAPCDRSDLGLSGLLDLKTGSWSTEVLRSVAPDLSQRLGEVGDSSSSWPISPYLVTRYGFSPKCRVTSCTGDNPSSMAGLALGRRDLALSLGTSDSLFTRLDTLPRSEGDTEIYMMYSPVMGEEELFMSLLSSKNGSLTRERARDTWAGGCWDKFSCLLEQSPPGNGGNIGLYLDLPEVWPRGVMGDFRVDKEGGRVERFGDPGTEVRAVVEGQVMAKKVQLERLGGVLEEGARMLVTGGASANAAIIQVVADVFQVPVYTQVTTPNSAAMGGAYRALHTYLSPVAWESMVSSVSSSYKLTCSPSKEGQEVYSALCKRLGDLVDRLKGGLGTCFELEKEWKGKGRA